MTFRQRIRTALVTLTAALVIAPMACRSPTGTGDLIRADGMVQRSVEGCFRIVTPTGAYQPLTMPSGFQVDGLAVRFEARPKPTFNTCMAGDVVELVRIERRS